MWQTLQLFPVVKRARGTSCCQRPVDLIDKKKSGGLIIKLSKAFLVLFLLVLVNVLKCVAVGAVSHSPLEEMSSFLLRCRRSTTNNASLYEVKTNTRQQLLVKLLEDGRVWGPLWPLK